MPRTVPSVRLESATKFACCVDNGRTVDPAAGPETGSSSDEGNNTAEYRLKIESGGPESVTSTRKLSPTCSCVRSSGEDSDRIGAPMAGFAPTNASAATINAEQIV